jgi:hypothetical protein
MKKSLLIVLILLLAASIVFAGGQPANSGQVTVRLGLWPDDDHPEEIAMHREYVR